VRVLTRQSHEDGAGIEFVTGDLAKDEGIEAAVEGAEIIVHCAGTAKGDEDKAQTLVRAASRGGTPHLVYISVVGDDQVPVESGVDRAMFGYYASKLAAERAVADSGLPWTTLRATQFHDLILKTAKQISKLPVVPVPAGFQFQPIDTGEVADRLVELAVGPPAERVPDFAGPRIYEMADLVRGYLRASHKHRPILPIRLPGKAARAVREGATLAPDRAVGHRTWEEFLADRVSSSGKGSSSPTLKEKGLRIDCLFMIRTGERSGSHLDNTVSILAPHVDVAGRGWVARFDAVYVEARSSASDAAGGRRKTTG
jgi:uncharacterized protein YbjT (DUF2867 family)